MSGSIPKPLGAAAATHFPLQPIAVPAKSGAARHRADGEEEASHRCCPGEVEAPSRCNCQRLWEGHRHNQAPHLADRGTPRRSGLAGNWAWALELTEASTEGHFPGLGRLAAGSWAASVEGGAGGSAMLTVQDEAAPMAANPSTSPGTIGGSQPMYYVEV